MLFSFCARTQTLSESFSYTVGKPYQVIDADEKYYFHLGDYYIAVKIVDDVMNIQEFDITSLNLIKKIAVSDFPKGYGWESIAVINKKFYIFYNSYDKAKNTEQLFYRELDTENMTLSADKLLCSVSGKITGTFYGKGYSFKTRDKFDLSFSYDSSNVYIKYRKKPASGSETMDSVGFFKFDKNLNQLWTKTAKMPYTEKKMSPIDYSFDSEGNIYYLVAVSDDNTDISKCLRGKAGCHFELLRMTTEAKKFSKTTVTLGVKYARDVALFSGPKNYMICAGYYNKTKNLYNVDGVFVFKAGKDSAIYDVNTYEIPLEILNQYASTKTQNKNDKKDEKDKAEFEDLIMKNIIIDSDGSILLIGEQNYDITTTTTSSNGGTSSHTRYYYNDMLVTKLSAAGKLAWMKKLPKRQVGSKGKGGLSFKYIYCNNNHYLLFLDNIKNQALTINDVPDYHVDEAGGFLTAYEVKDASGDVTKHSIFDTKSVKGIPVYQFSTGRIKRISSNEFIVEVYKKDKQDELIKITVTE
jgi:hypothetical protein